MYHVILFDLDGTVIDPWEGIVNSVSYTLEKYQLPKEEWGDLRRFIGPPLIESFQRLYGFSHDKAEEAVGRYREYYRETGIFECYVYDGIPQLLERLKAAGRTVLMATSKPEEFAVRILQHFGLMQYFDCVAGATLDESRNAKADVIRYGLKRAGLQSTGDCIMVGDRKHDILGARACQMASLGVLFGYGSREELVEAGADWIAETVEEAGRLLGV